MADKLGPYELNSIYTGECAEKMRALPDACIDLTVTSPPYDNLRDYKGYTFDFEPIAAELFRATKPGGVVVWVVGDAVVNGSETGTSFRQALGFIGLGFRLHDTMIYDSHSVRYPDVTRYHQSFEYMFVFSRGRPKTINLIKDHKKRWFGPRGKKTKRARTGELYQSHSFSKANENKEREYGVRFNIWRYATGAGSSTKDDMAFEHPAIFPEALARDHILSWSNPGDVVLDPMCGSGTTLKTAKQRGRRWLGFDIAKEYVELARQRVAQTQPPLFV